MKKVAIFVLIALGAASCKRIYQCECTRVVNGESWNPMITNLPVEARNKKDAKALCNSSSYNLGWQDYQNCKLKD
ncbi:MAG: hypothetical protein K0R65_1172 [Crocinitomicaceae bacterium]|jgi:hypothetical protein|nr:hypothetical protein [Crocinitomicaceae bacterium]